VRPGGAEAAGPPEAGRPAAEEPRPCGGRGPEGPAARLDALGAELEERFRAWGRDPAPWPEELFGELALRAFALQFEAVPVYRAYCARRGRDPDAVSDWRDIPPVPTAAFRQVELSVLPPAERDLVFRTSGTTRGAGRRGRHRVARPSLYRAALEPPFERFVLGAGGPAACEGAEDRAHRIGSLVPPFEAAAGSSLSYMCDDVLRTLGAPGSEALADAEGADPGALLAFAEACAGDGVPACLLATTLGLDAALAALEERGARAALPDGSVVMDTGGAKGRPGLRREDVLARLEAVLGVPRGRVVNEFGMTELLSQRYGRGAGAAGPAGPPQAGGGEATPLLAGPPWLRTRVLDPVTLEPLPEGEAGVLCHVDLANAASAVAVLTEDLGRVRDGGLAWIGRAPGSPPRGCSLATAELLEARARAGPGAGDGDAGGGGRGPVGGRGGGP